MKTMIPVLVLSIFAALSARADDVWVQCRNANRLPNGLAVSVYSDGGQLFAKLAYRDNLGPVETADPLPVTRGPVPQGETGTPVVFLGDGFELSVNFTTAPIRDGYSGHVVAGFNGRTISQDLICLP